ncbi:MAG: hypothetical protein JWQ35_226 [Bacteriovoracaceae bacterium]|nr:hypothetical protein [Bacteriovoracaceae bacterium]
MGEISHDALNGVQYRIFEGRRSANAYTQSQNALYQTWKLGWDSTFQELRSDSIAQSPDFLRQTLVAGLFIGEQKVIGLQAYSFFNVHLEAHLEHPYFRTYPSAVLDALKSRGAHQFMTMEYLYVDPNWRRSIIGISMADVICSLGLKIFSNSANDAVISITRNERKVNQMLYDKGAECLAKDLQLHNVTVDIIGFFKNKILETSSEEANLAKKLWEERLDTTLPTEKIIRAA